MTRIAHIADSHIDEASRFEECVRLHDYIADDIARRGADLILHAGDVFNQKSTPRERMAFAALLAKLADIAPVVIVRGNHDAVGDLPLFAKLEAKHPITVVETAGVVHAGGCAVACLAWPRRAELLARAGDVGNEAGNQLAAEALRNVLRGMGRELGKHYGPRILLAHAMVRGSVTSTGQPLVGCDMELGLEDLALCDADFVALGHIHKAQEWTFGTTPIVYPGSPRRTAFGELEDKGYALIDIHVGVDERAAVRWEFVAAPATRMIQRDASWDSGLGELLIAGGLPLPADIEGSEIRVRYEVDSDQRAAAREEASALRDLLVADGAVSVKIEESVRATTRARAPEVATAVSIEDKLRVLWKAKGIDVGNDRERRVLGLLAEVEAA